MSENFESGLRDLYTRAAQAHAGGSGFPEAAMVGRARRNRRVRTAAVSAVAVVAVVGVALGGAAAVRLGDPAPVPPAETVSPSPTTPVAGLTCGLAIADLAVFDDAPVTIEALLDDAVVAPGEPLTTRVTVAAVHPPGGDVGEDSLTLLTFAAVQDGVVVGLGLGTVDPGSTQGLSGRSGVTALSTIDLATCGEDGEAVSPLDVGGYQLYAGLTASFAGSGGEQRMLLGGPWPFTITDAATTDEQTPDTLPLLPPEDHYQESSSVSAIPLSEDSLEDGDYFGYLSGIDAAAGTVQVDIAIFYTGQAAIDYLTANDPTAENPPPGGFWIVNDVERIRSLTLSPDVRIWDWCYGNDLGFAERTLPEWAAAPATGEHSCDAGATLSHGWGDGTYRFDVRDGVVMQVIGQYLP